MGPDVLRLIERDVREPGVGEIRVAVRAAAVHPSDIGFRTRGIQGVPPPWVPGWDAAGTIESVGAGVSGFEVGEPVMAVVGPRRPDGGAQSQLVVAPAASVVPLPADLTPEQASTLPMNGLTALQALELLDLRRRRDAPRHRGAGLLASYAIPLAKRAGLRVLADASVANEESGAGVRRRCRAARAATDSSLPSATRFPRASTAVIDTAVLGRTIFPAICEGGALAFLRTWEGDEVEGGITISRVWVGDVLERTDWLRDIGELGTPGSASSVGDLDVPTGACCRRASSDGGRRPARPSRDRLRVSQSAWPGSSPTTSRRAASPDRAVGWRSP